MEVSDLITSLKKLKAVLDVHRKYGWTLDSGGISSAIQSLEYQKKRIQNGAVPFSFEVKNLRFKLAVDNFKHSNPNDCQQADLFLSIAAELNDKEINLSSISMMNINIEIISVDIRGRKYKSAWHLDYHDTDFNEEFSHPKFHFQFGGKNLRESVLDPNKPIQSGEIYLIESPRLAHPPMDTVLAVDFVVSNFIGRSALQNLRSDAQFRPLLRESSDTLWKPYFTELNDFFSTSPTAGKNAKFLNPGLPED